MTWMKEKRNISKKKRTLLSLSLSLSLSCRDKATFLSFVFNSQQISVSDVKPLLFDIPMIGIAVQVLLNSNPSPSHLRAFSFTTFLMGMIQLDSSVSLSGDLCFPSWYCDAHFNPPPQDPILLPSHLFPPSPLTILFVICYVTFTSKPQKPNNDFTNKSSKRFKNK